MKAYKVVITETVTREYEVGQATSPEAAVSTAEEFWRDGEPGFVVDKDILESEAVESDNDTSM